MDYQKVKDNLEKYNGYSSQKTDENKMIEQSILTQIISFLRIYEERDMYSKVNAKKDFEEYLKNKNNDETELRRFQKDLEQMRKATDNYKMSELFLFIMSNAHNMWLEKNKGNLLKKNIVNPYNYVPFELLKYDDIDRYLNVLYPITKALNIDIDCNELRKAHERKQIAFLIENKIFSETDLKNIIKQPCKIYSKIDEMVNDGDITLKQILELEKIADVIAKGVSKKIELNISKHLKETLKSDKKNVGIVKIKDLDKRKRVFRFLEDIKNKKIGVKKLAFPRPNKPINKVLYDIVKTSDVIFAQNIKKYDYKYFDLKNHVIKEVDFIPQEKCTSEQKRQIEKRNKKLKTFKAKVENCDSKKYDIPGIITMIYVGNNENQVVQLEITKRELAEIDILPSEIGWEEKNKALINMNKNNVTFIPNNDYCENSRKKEKNEMEYLKWNSNEKDSVKKVNKTTYSKNEADKYNDNNETQNR